MGAAAELNGLAAHIHNTHGVAVFFSEQGHGAEISGFLDGHFLYGNIHAVQYHIVDLAHYKHQLIGLHSGKMGEIKSQSVLFHKGTGLAHMAAKHVLQRLLQQMSS